MRSLRPDLFFWIEQFKKKPLAVFLDYDGTLVDIAPTPAQAVLPLSMSKLLRRLLRHEDVRVAVISGRPLRDLYKKVPLKGVELVGSHGLEFRNRKLALQPVARGYSGILRSIGEILFSRMSLIPGVLFERKPFSLATHFRQAPVGAQAKIRRTIEAVCSQAAFRKQIILLRGKKVIEIMPVNAPDKGKAARQLLHVWGRKKFLPIFIGDDITDESGFLAFRDSGLTVKVGGRTGMSAAEYYVDGVSDVGSLLEMILRLKSGVEPCSSMFLS